ncbi:hypothetical protein GINT2_001868 [Glugoides intestinalis]
MRFFIIFILGAFTHLSARFFNEDGIEIKSPEEHTNFMVIVNTEKMKIFLNGANHHYDSMLNIFQDPCYYRLDGVFSKAAGHFDICSKSMEFFHHGKQYNIKLNSPLDDRENNGVKRRNDRYVIKEPFETLLALENKDVPYRIGIFIFNDFGRVLRHGKEINRNTVEIFKKVKQIFSESGLKVEPILEGVLNIRDEIDFIAAEKGALETFKDNIEPIRFSPLNLENPLAKADLVLLIAEPKFPIRPEKTKIIHGMTFYGGSSRLDTSYSVVFASQNDSDYFIAKKIAHEIGHSLGASHNLEGTLMEKVTCKNCENDKRQFNKSSKMQIEWFLAKHKKVFGAKNDMKYHDDQILKSTEEALKYAEERRRHGLIDIVKTRLRGRLPMSDESNYYSILTIFLYALTVLLILLYWK